MSDLFNPYIIKTRKEELIMERAEANKTLLEFEDRRCPVCKTWRDEWTGICPFCGYPEREEDYEGGE